MRIELMTFGYLAPFPGESYCYETDVITDYTKGAREFQ